MINDAINDIDDEEGRRTPPLDERIGNKLFAWQCRCRRRGNCAQVSADRPTDRPTDRPEQLRWDLRWIIIGWLFSMEAIAHEPWAIVSSSSCNYYSPQLKRRTYCTRSCVHVARWAHVAGGGGGLLLDCRCRHTPVGCSSSSSFSWLILQTCRLYFYVERKMFFPPLSSLKKYKTPADE